MRKILYSMLIAASTLAASYMPASAATGQQMRFHCANDTTEINQLLKKGIESGLTKPNELVTFYAHELMGRPYVANTLEGEPEMLTINVDQLDCTTFVETLYALTRTTLNGRYSWRDYATNLENLRYRNGTIKGYTSRLHYISDWAVDNTSRGNLTELTSDLPGVRYLIKTLDFMSTHRDAYAALKNDSTYEKLRDFEIAYRNHRFPYISKQQMKSKKLIEQLESGDFVALVTKVDGLDVTHMGIIEKKGNDIYLLDASSNGGKVQLETDDMMEMLRRQRSNLGIRVFRIRQ